MAEKAATEKCWFGVSLLPLLSWVWDLLFGVCRRTRVYNNENWATCQALRKLRNVFLNYVFKSV